ncbi:TonB-dependent receptor, partial [Bacteroides acidifaciens]|uniref:SusC/RagA family TonB-linked outer membrane protein n=1 Tax=Bacteroides acidifaciens TaxID=85831 RepID=UPI0030154579
PIIGASVLEKGVQGNGTITDIDGVFKLSVSSSKALLDISYIGYQSQTVAVQVGKNLKIILQEDSKQLDEVVVVGYGTQSKKTLTGAVSMVNMGDVEMNTVPNVSRALAGKAAGFRVNQISAQPGGEAKFRIRGETSISAGNEPLFVIDGFPVSSSGNLSSGNGYYESGNIDNVLESLNPDDIESISVLKDAASTAIYGARAGHGVVLITTKRGKSQKPRVTYSGMGSVQVARSNYKMLDTRMYMDMYNKQQYEEWMKLNGMGIYEEYVAKPEKPTQYKPAFNNDEILLASGTDWLDAVMRNGYTQQHNLSVNGGTEKTRYLASVNYMDQEGIVKNNGVSRFSARLNLDQELNEYVSFGLTATYTQNRYDNVPLGDGQNEYSGVLTGAIESNPTIPIYDAEGNYYIDPKRPFVANPVSLLEIQDNTVKDRLMGSAFVSVKPLKELEVKLQLGADRSFQKRSSYLPKTTLQGANKNGRADISQSTNTTYLMELTAQYAKSFGDHNVKVIGGYSFQKFKNDGFSAGNSDFLVDGFGYNSLGSGNYKKPSVASWASINSIASLFARANYSYQGRYLLEATLRADAASNFAPENRWGYFPSVSAGWMISEENFMKGASKWLSMLKLRASYGQTGNSNVGYRIYDYYEVGKNSIIGGAESTGVYASDLGNKSITWETTTEFNLGVDFGIFNNRFKLAAEYFKRKITDLLRTDKPLPFYNEINTIAGNIGATQSQGVEITLNTVNIVTKDFEWDTTLTLSHY